MAESSPDSQLSSEEEEIVEHTDKRVARKRKLPTRLKESVLDGISVGTGTMHTLI